MDDEEIARWMQAGRIPQRELGLLPLIMTGGVSEVLNDHLVDPDRRSVDALVDEITRVWLLVLRGL